MENKKMDVPFIGYLDDKEIIINSLDILDKIICNNIQINDEFNFSCHNDIKKDIINKIRNGQVNLRIKFYNIEVVLNLIHHGGGWTDKEHTNYKCTIKDCEIISKPSKQDFIKIYQGKFIISKDDEYYLVYRKSENEYYTKIATGDTLDRINYYLEKNILLIDKKKWLKSAIDYKFEHDNKDGQIIWERLDINSNFKIIY